MSSSSLCSLHPVEGVSPVRAALPVGGPLPLGVWLIFCLSDNVLLHSPGFICTFFQLLKQRLNLREKKTQE